MPKREDKRCFICGTSSAFVCGKCYAVHYCSRNCQKQHWKEHKKSCGKPADALQERPIQPGDKCTRCLQVIQADDNGGPILTGCRVPHPADRQESMGSMFGPDGMTLNLLCTACGHNYQRSSPGITPNSEAPITFGPEWCFQGMHTIQPVEKLGDRRIKSELVTITANEEMQDDIDALDGNVSVTILRICAGGMYSSSLGDDAELPKLRIELPNLKEVQFEDVNMGQIHLTKELTPNVEIISMQNPSESETPDFKIECAKLKRFSCHYWCGDPTWANTMLEHATKLESFDSYKFRVPFLRFASNRLDNIRLHRAELLQYLQLYAPRLTMLDVQAAYDLDEIRFVDQHPTLSKKLPKNFSFRFELEVNAVNACLGPAAKQAIRNHPRFQGDLEEVDDDDFMGFNPMESHFCRMHNS